MILEDIKSPSDLKRLKLPRLKSLCSQLRQYIIEVVSHRGGHLASNLGVVELSVGLCYCLDLPKDKVIWDVGHQCYAYKILTGRKEGLRRLRTLGGLSGFPSPQESLEFDPFYTGHASTAMSLALGMCCARDILKEDFRVVAVIGDGSLSGGMCFEALNNAGHLKKDILVILNSNEMSISPTVGAISTYVNRIITNPLYNRFRKELSRFIEGLPLPIRKLSVLLKKLEESAKSILVPGILFEELGFRYFGPLDGHNLKLLISTLKNIVDLPGPKILHIVTKKGKGFLPAENNPELFHSAAPFDKETGQIKKKPPLSFTRVFSNKLIELAKKDPRIVGITAAMSKGTGLEAFAKEFPQRFFDVGIAEAHGVTFASALSRRGLKPVVAIYSTFLQRAYDQLIHDVALQGSSPLFVLDRAGLVGEDGPTHHGIFDIAYMRTLPHLVIMAPKDKEELEDMLEFALKLNLPASIRFPKDEAFSTGFRSPLALGMPEVVKRGEDICFLCLGTTIKPVLESLELFSQQKIYPTVINTRFVKPLNKDFIEQVLRSHRLIITVEEGIVCGGFGSSILEICQERDLSLSRVKCVGLSCDFITFGRREELLNMQGLSAQGILRKTLAFLKEEEFV